MGRGPGGEAVTPTIGDRRPREGRCEKCDLPLCAATDGNCPPGVCHSEYYGNCAGEPIDWRTRALDAEAQLADAEARGRLHGLFAAAWALSDRTVTLPASSASSAVAVLLDGAFSEVVALAEATDDRR